MLEGVVLGLTQIRQNLSDAAELFEMAKAENDEASLQGTATDIQDIEKRVADMEFRRMFSHPMDPNNCFIDIQSGSGGTEAQDWASMAHPSRFPATMPTVICAPKPACTGWCANHRLTPATAVTLRSRACSSTPKWTNPSKWKSIRPTCAWTPIAPAARAGS